MTVINKNTDYGPYPISTDSDLPRVKPGNPKPSKGIIKWNMYYQSLSLFNQHRKQFRFQFSKLLNMTIETTMPTLHSCSACTLIYLDFFKRKFREFPGGAEVKTQHFQLGN